MVAAVNAGRQESQQEADETNDAEDAHQQDHHERHGIYAQHLLVKSKTMNQITDAALRHFGWLLQ